MERSSKGRGGRVVQEGESSEEGGELKGGILGRGSSGRGKGEFHGTP